MNFSALSFLNFLFEKRDFVVSLVNHVPTDSFRVKVTLLACSIGFYIFTGRSLHRVILNYVESTIPNYLPQQFKRFYTQERSTYDLNAAYYMATTWQNDIDC